MASHLLIRTNAIRDAARQDRQPAHLDRAIRSGCLCCLALALTSMGGCGSSPTTLALENPPRSDDGLSVTKPADAPKTTAAKVAPVTPVAPSTQTPAGLEVAVPDKLPPMTIEPKLAEVSADRLVGRWEDSFFGKRTLILNADGSARMILDLDLAGQLLYGSRLEFDMKWSVEAAKVTIDLLEGKPEKSAKSAMTTWGNRYVYLLDCVEDHRIEMRSSDGSMSHTLRRVGEADAS